MMIATAFVMYSEMSAMVSILMIADCYWRWIHDLYGSKTQKKEKSVLSVRGVRAFGEGGVYLICLFDKVAETLRDEPLADRLGGYLRTLYYMGIKVPIYWVDDCSGPVGASSCQNWSRSKIFDEEKRGSDV